MYPHRAWDPGLDTQAGRRGYGQPQQGQQAQGQSASVSWQDQTRGNPAAEYAQCEKPNLRRSRITDERKTAHEPALGT